MGKIIVQSENEWYHNMYHRYKVVIWSIIAVILWYSLNKINLFQGFAGWIAIGFLVLMFISDLSSDGKLKAYTKIAVSIPLLFVGYKILSFAFEVLKIGETNMAIFIAIFGFILIGFGIFYIKQNKWVLERKFGFRFGRLGSKKRKKLMITILIIVGVVIIWNLFIAGNGLPSFDDINPSQRNIQPDTPPQAVPVPEVVKSPFYDDFFRTEARKLHCGQPQHEVRELLYPLKYTHGGNYNGYDVYEHEGNTLTVHYSNDKNTIVQMEIHYNDGSEKPSYIDLCGR
ncbi:MAG: hypothetical protein ABIH82_05645 [Candidatus Woesearchaeota archaeon]